MLGSVGPRLRQSVICPSWVCPAKGWADVFAGRTAVGMEKRTQAGDPDERLSGWKNAARLPGDALLASMFNSSDAETQMTSVTILVFVRGSWG